ncbi:MAG TPA: ABC transporter ATP-binding protein [Cyanobacteria bacterium UBA8803]|nr:ABC transporter ATP-binding protein [Cyanobacteria bacterium UBA9273]HBL57681.1 ABC transporter ATP-binding protein [Cyanobacteria bacterium UBA8803]
MGTISFENVSLQFPSASQAALQGVSFEIQVGQLVVILGPSGCGKTTLLKMVNRLYEPTSGRIYLDGTDIRLLKVTKLRQQIGYVIQQSGLFPHMTVAQNIAVVPKLLGWSRIKYQSRVDELLTLVELPPEIYRNRYPAQLSGGQQQRVGVARALAGDPKVILMDEPFGAIDAITRQTLQDEILRLQRQLKKTILFVSHDVEEALRLADKIMILQQGQIVQFDTPFNILTRPANAFVHELVGAGDVLRQLGLLRVEAAMRNVPEGSSYGSEYAIAPQDNLRQALSLLLRTGVEYLHVVDGEKLVGVLTLEQICHLTRE